MAVRGRWGSLLKRGRSHHPGSVHAGPADEVDGPVTVKAGACPPPRESALERTFAFQVMAHRLPKPERELRFDRGGRKWRFDFAWPENMVAVELEGGIWNNGAHVRGAHFTSDCEKYNAAQAQGWKVFRFPGKLVNSGEAISFLKKVLDNYET